MLPRRPIVRHIPDKVPAIPGGPTGPEFAAVTAAVEGLERPHHIYAEVDPAITTTSPDIAGPLQTLLDTYRMVEFRGQGTYISSQVDVPAGTTLIVPEGVTLKLADGTDETLLVVAGRAVGDGVLDGNRANQAVDNKAVCYLDAPGARVKGLTIINAPGEGVAVGPTAVGAKVEDLTVSGSTTYGIRTDADDTAIQGNIVYADDVTGTWAGIRVHAPSGLTVSRVRIANNTVVSAQPICIELWGVDAGSVISPTITGNTLTGGNMGVSIDKTVGASVIGNTATDFEWYGYELAAAVDCTVSGNTADGADGATTSGVEVSAGSTGGVISANTIRRCKTGVHVYQSSGLQIASNAINDGPPSSGRAIWLQQSPGCVVASNLMVNGDVGIRLEGTDRVTFMGNMFNGIPWPWDFIFDAGPWDNIMLWGNSAIDYTASPSGWVDGSATFGGNIRITGNIGIPDDYDFGDLM